MVAGAKGAVASTLAVALAAMRRDPAAVLPSLTTGDMFAGLGPLAATSLAGWDTSEETYTAAHEAQTSTSLGYHFNADVMCGRCKVRWQINLFKSF